MTATASTTAHAALLRDRGFALCKPDPGQKKPTYAGWPTRSLEPDDFGPGDLIGILAGPLSNGGRPGHALVVPDLDATEAVENADNFLPLTGMVEGRPGKDRDHRYFLVPCDSIPPWAVSQAEQAAPAARKLRGHAGPFKKQFRHAATGKVVIDFLGTGSQVVGPSAGNQRQWANGEPGEPAVVPFLELWDTTCKLALACGCKLPFAREDGSAPPVRQDGAAGWTDRDLIARRVVPYLATCDPAVEGQGGHDRTYWPARVVCWGFALSEDLGLQVLMQHFNPRCRPPWSEAELRHKCHDAATQPFDKPWAWLRDTPPPHALNGGNRPHPPDPPPADPPPGETGQDPDPVHLTDLGNARRLARDYSDRLRHCHPWGKDFIYDGVRWSRDETAETERFAKDLVRRLYQEAGALADKKQRKLLAAHAVKCEDIKRLRAMVSLARSEPGIPVVPAELDADPWLLNVLNGTIDLRSGRDRPHRREDLVTKLAPVAHDPGARCPRWERFLLEIMDGNAGLVEYLRRAVGYALTGDVREQCLFFFFGVGANGKSTFLDVLLALLGDYGCQAIPELLMLRHGDAHPTERAELFGRRFVSCIETEDGKRIAEALLKQLTGGDRITARRMREDFWQFLPTHKLFLAANHKPIIRGNDHAVWRRIKLVPFTVTFAESRRDKELPAKLRAELPGILNWALGGCLAWQREGLAEPEEVRQATGGYQAEMDVVARFLEECCNVHPDCRAPSKYLYPAYVRWAEEGKEKPLTRDAFGRRLKEKGFENKRSGEKGATVWHGLMLRDADEAGH